MHNPTNPEKWSFLYIASLTLSHWSRVAAAFWHECLSNTASLAPTCPLSARPWPLGEVPLDSYCRKWRKRISPISQNRRYRKRVLEIRLITYIMRVDRFMSKKSIKCSGIVTGTDFVDFLDIIYVETVKKEKSLSRLLTYNVRVDRMSCPRNDTTQNVLVHGESNGGNIFLHCVFVSSTPNQLSNPSKLQLLALCSSTTYRFSFVFAKWFKRL